MPQQVNLCLPILRKQRRRFAAQSLVQALAVLLLVGGALSAAWVWNLNLASDSLKVTLAAQTQELDGLRVALVQSKANAGPADAAMVSQVQQRKQELLQREKVLAALRQGLVSPGQGHAARLALVATTIPSEAWVTHIKVDDRLLEVTGYTLEPSVLNDWVGKLSHSPLLQGQALSTVKVESVKPEFVQPVATNAMPLAMAGSVAAVPATRAPVALPPRWAFSLLSSVAASATAQTPAGGKP